MSNTGWIHKLATIIAFLLVATEAFAYDKAGLTIDHGNYDPSALSGSELLSAAALDVYFEHASVGDNIVAGIASLAAASPRYRSGRASWSQRIDLAWWAAHDGLGDNQRGNPDAAAKVKLFKANMTAAMAAAVDVAMFKFCYIDSPLDSQCVSLDAHALFSAVQSTMESLEARYPAVAFVWWTMPIQTSHNAQRQAYNGLVRSYCAKNRKWLFDIADLESHDDRGAAVLQGTRELLYRGYAADDGHLNAAGQHKMAKAYWRLLAEIAKTR